MRKLFVSLILVASSLWVLADTNQWTGNSSTNWHTASNWTLNRVPLATDDAVIPGAPSNKPIISGSNAVCYSLTIQAGATLTIQSSRTLTLNGNWFNEAGASGFVANTGTVSFSGTIIQQINNSSGTETFYHLVVNKSGGVVMTWCSFIIMGDLTLLEGNFEAQNIGKTYTFYGNVTFNGSGLFWPQGTCYFKGATNTSFQNNGYNASFVDFMLEKTNASNKLTLYADLVCTNVDLATVQKGILDLGGFRFQSAAPILINNGGKMYLPPGSTLNIRNSLKVNSGGEFEVAGNPDNPPLIYRDGNYYSFEVNSGGTIKAEHAIFQNMNADGIQIKAGAIVDPDKAFNFCSFGFGSSGGVLLTINNNQTFTVTEAYFGENYWGSAYNVRKTVNAGNVTFYASSGLFAGEDYDDDIYNRINWVAGVPTNHSIFIEYIFNGTTQCFNAKQTITAQYLYVFNGGQATLIAGHSIILLPNSVVYEGGTFHAWITTNQTYCNNLQSLVAVTDESGAVGEKFDTVIEEEMAINIFPNPTAGVITLEFMDETGKALVEIYNIHADCVIKKKLTSAGSYRCDLSSLAPGVYLLRLTTDDKIVTKKLIKN